MGLRQDYCSSPSTLSSETLNVLSYILEDNNYLRYGQSSLLRHHVLLQLPTDVIHAYLHYHTVKFHATEHIIELIMSL